MENSLQTHLTVQSKFKSQSGQNSPNDAWASAPSVEPSAADGDAGARPALSVAALRFVVGGGTCFGVNLAILWVATEKWKWHYLLALLLAWSVVFVLGFSLHRRWTFGSRSKAILGEARRYFMVNLGQAVVSTGLLILLVSGFGLAPWLASVIIGASLMVFTFLLHRNWSFA